MDSTKVNRRKWRPPVAIASALMLVATLLPLASASAAVGSPPQNLVATAGPGAVELAWDAPTSDAATVTGYRIRRRLPDEGETRFTTLVADTGSAETTYTDLTANSDGTRYEYRIKALWDNARSRRSDTAEAVGQAESTEEPGEVIGTSLEYVSPPEPEPVITQQQQAEELDNGYDIDDIDDTVVDVCERPSSIVRDDSGDKEVKDFKLYVMSNDWWQTGDYLEWISPITVGLDTVESYTVERQQRTDDGWSGWTDLGTHCNQHGRHRYTILEDQPPCTDWAIRVWANFFDTNRDGEKKLTADGQTIYKDSGAWKKKFSFSAARQRPSRPSLTETHTGMLDDQDLTAKWTRDPCQTEYQVRISTRDGDDFPSDGYDDNGDLIYNDDGDVIGINDGWTTGSIPSGFDGTDSKSTFTLEEQEFDTMGDGVRIKVRVRNLAGWSRWSTLIWQRGFRISNSGVILITR